MVLKKVLPRFGSPWPARSGEEADGAPALASLAVATVSPDVDAAPKGKENPPPRSWPRTGGWRWRRWDGRCGWWWWWGAEAPSWRSRSRSSSSWRRDSWNSSKNSSSRKSTNGDSGSNNTVPRGFGGAQILVWIRIPGNYSLLFFTPPEVLFCFEQFSVKLSD